MAFLGSVSRLQAPSTSVRDARCSVQVTRDINGIYHMFIEGLVGISGRKGLFGGGRGGASFHHVFSWTWSIFTALICISCIYTLSVNRLS